MIVVVQVSICMIIFGIDFGDCTYSVTRNINSMPIRLDLKST